MVAITAFISPYRADRRRARRIAREGEGTDIPFFEIYLDTPLAVCEARDPKGLYAKARSGVIKQFTGISDPYEAPEQPEITLKTGDDSVDVCLARLLGRLVPELEVGGGRRADKTEAQ